LDKFAEWEKNVDKITKKSDIILTTSASLYKIRNEEHPRVYLVRNACEPQHIGHSHSMPPKLKGLKRPIIGFIGAVGQWVNIEILDKIASKYTTVVIGPEFEQSLPANVIKIGKKEYQQLPNYYNNIDIGIIPFYKNETTKAVNPIKMYEYLAAGKPIVATELPEMKLFPNHIFTANNIEQFFKAIKKAKKAIKPELERERKKIARRHSWESRFEKIELILNNYQKK
jgi:glycosyltransferase involved in cell wall biosynthesis